MAEVFVAVVPVVFIGGLVWFGISVVSSLRRIEAALGHENLIAPEFSRGS